MRKSTMWTIAGMSAGMAAAGAAAYGLIARPWHLRWGATREELVAPMPFDGLIPGANYFTTRAITIAATPEQLWPFVVDLRAMPPGTIIRRAEKNRCVMFAPPEVEAEATWVVVLEPRGNATRLVSRNRARFPGDLSGIMRYLLVDPGQFVFERNWMLDIKAKAEKVAAAPQPSAAPQLSAAPRASAAPQASAARQASYDEVQVAELVP